MQDFKLVASSSDLDTATKLAKLYSSVIEKSFCMGYTKVQENRVWQLFLRVRVPEQISGTCLFGLESTKLLCIGGLKDALATGPFWILKTLPESKTGPLLLDETSNKKIKIKKTNEAFKTVRFIVKLEQGAGSP